MSFDDKEKTAWNALYGEGGIINRDGKISSVIKSYDSVAVSYESTLQVLQYNAPAVLADCLMKNVSTDTHNMNILDIGAGTGLVGKRLADKGYTGQMVAVDASPLMLAQAKETGFYNRIICKVLSPESPFEISSESFDAIVSAGSFVQNYIVPEVIYDLLPGLKVDGLLIITVRTDSVVSNRSYESYVALFESTLQTLYDTGKAKLVSREKFVNYDVSFDEKGRCDGFEAIVVCLRKL